MMAHRRFIVQLACVIAMPILYVASSAPVLHFCARLQVATPLVSALYKPLFQIPTTRDFVIRYLVVFDPMGEDKIEGLYTPAF
jgi:hypothetical protein